VSFVEKAIPPPDLEEGAILKARIIGIQKVTSKWKDDEGNPKEQLQFDLELENGYKCRTWCAFYERPAEKSKLGKLVLKFVEATKKDVHSINEFLGTLKDFGYVFVKCSGFREYEDELYPNFTILTDKIPAPAEKRPTTEKAVAEPDRVAYLKTVILEAMKLGEVYARLKLVEFGKVEDFGDIEIERAINALLEEGKIRPKFEALNLVGFLKAP
jgi:hypothetical protein